MLEQIKNDRQSRRIDLAFQRMSQDPAYQKEAELITAEFEESDWEALETRERVQQPGSILIRRRNRK